MIDFDAERICTRCNIQKPVSKFYRSKSRFASACKKCTSERAKELKQERDEYDPVIIAHREREGLGLKLCPRCKEQKPVGAFKLRSPGEGKFKAYCIPCEKVYIAEYQATHIETRRSNFRKREYGLGTGEFDRLMLSQDDRCAICRDSIGPDCHVDHNHATGVVRGLLCFHCNLALGHLKDDPIRARGILEYLEQS